VAIIRSSTFYRFAAAAIFCATALPFFFHARQVHAQPTPGAVSGRSPLVAPALSRDAAATSPLPSPADNAPAAATTEARDRLYREILAEVVALEKQGNLLKKVVRLVKPTVVHIEATREDDLPRRKPVEESGSGVILRYRDKHYVVTNRHVIDESPLGGIKVKLWDGRVIYPVKRWADPETDIAVLAVNAPRLIPVRLGNSDKLEIGDFVLAVGSPFGLSHSVTYGIISAKGRRDLDLGAGEVRYQDFIQTDAAINPGNSGGPLMNLRGEVVGINTAIASNSGGNEGIGFSIPINMVRVIAQQLIEKGRVERAFMGVRLDSRFNAAQAARLGLSTYRGARITSVTAGSPAGLASLEVGDVILQFDGVIIEDDNHLVNRVSLTPVGKQVPVIFYRDNKRLLTRVTVGDRSKLFAKPK